MSDPKCFTISLRNEHYIRSEIKAGDVNNISGLTIPLGVAILSHHKIPDTEILAFGSVLAGTNFIKALDTLDYETTKNMFMNKSEGA